VCTLPDGHLYLPAVRSEEDADATRAAFNRAFGRLGKRGI
jgi:hypothetical protein